MVAFVVVMGLGIVLGLLRGGSFENMKTARLNLMPVMFGAFGLQVLAQFLPAGLDTLAYIMVLASFGLIFVWAAANRFASGIAFIAIGAMMNLIVIGANQGMPISAEAAISSGYDGDLQSLVIRGKHIVDIDGTAKLRILSDWIPLGGHPSAASIGDLVLWAGIALLLQDLLLGPRGRRSRRQVDDEDVSPPPSSSHVRLTRRSTPFSG